jgi:hypothetical protein
MVEISLSGSGEGPGASKRPGLLYSAFSRRPPPSPRRRPPLDPVLRPEPTAEEQRSPSQTAPSRASGDPWHTPPRGGGLCPPAHPGMTTRPTPRPRLFAARGFLRPRVGIPRRAKHGLQEVLAWRRREDPDPVRLRRQRHCDVVSHRLPGPRRRRAPPWRRARPRPRTRSTTGPSLRNPDPSLVAHAHADHHGTCAGSRRSPPDLRRSRDDDAWPPPRSPDVTRGDTLLGSTPDLGHTARTP